ncbi:MAG: peptide deformylase [Gammaproteobacteria bacterium]|nr:peptide deformylase [Gammaproteobacteria bacterium]TVQ46943.1 MAG: peptide deformylase [Gammaproteobacteria bacterium]
MARRDVLLFPDPRLRLISQPVEDFDADLAQLADDLLETMYAEPAIGLSAPQVDVRRRLLVMDVSEKKTRPEVFVNPEVLASASMGWIEERCMSVPGRSGLVRRATEIKVRAQTLQGESFERRLKGLAAVCLLHELDHLDGRLFVDRLSWLGRLRFRAALALQTRRAA